MREADISGAQIRVVRLLMRLRRRWLDVYQIAAAADRDVQTARRDIAVLRRAGIKLTVRTEDFGRKEYRWYDGKENEE